MRVIVEALEAQDTELHALLVGLDADGWSSPTPCAGWDVADVVLHLAQTNEFAVASAAGGALDLTALEQRGGADLSGSVDAWAALAVERERGQPGAKVLARWHAAAEAQRAAFGGSDPHRRLRWVIGDLPARTLATTRLAETWIHSTDVAEALGVKLHGSERLWHVARLAWRTLPYAFEHAGRALHGPVAIALDAPGGGKWEFGLEAEPATVVRGDALEFCLVAARRREPAQTLLHGEGPDAEDVLALVRTYA